MPMGSIKRMANRRLPVVKRMQLKRMQHETNPVGPPRARVPRPRAGQKCKLQLHAIRFSADSLEFHQAGTPQTNGHSAIETLELDSFFSSFSNRERARERDTQKDRERKSLWTFWPVAMSPLHEKMLQQSGEIPLPTYWELRQDARRAKCSPVHHNMHGNYAALPATEDRSICLPPGGTDMRCNTLATTSTV